MRPEVAELTARARRRADEGGEFLFEGPRHLPGGEPARAKDLEDGRFLLWPDAGAGEGDEIRTRAHSRER